MKLRLLTQIPGMTLAVMLMLVVAQELGGGPEARAAAGGKLEGTWLLESTLVDCATGHPLPIPGNPFPSLHTYLRGGTMLDSGASPPRVPGGTRTSAHTFRVHAHSFGFDAEGVHVLTVEVTFERSLIQGKHAETDEIIGVGTAKIFAPTGEQVGTGCVNDRGRRDAFDEEE